MVGQNGNTVNAKCNGFGPRTCGGFKEVGGHLPDHLELAKREDNPPHGCQADSLGVGI